VRTLGPNCGLGVAELVDFDALDAEAVAGDEMEAVLAEKEGDGEVPLGKWERRKPVAIGIVNVQGRARGLGERHEQAAVMVERDVAEGGQMTGAADVTIAGGGPPTLSSSAYCSSVQGVGIRTYGRSSRPI
jgi:hypothetical protein